MNETRNQISEPWNDLLEQVQCSENKKVAKTNQSAEHNGVKILFLTFPPCF